MQGRIMPIGTPDEKHTLIPIRIPELQPLEPRCRSLLPFVVAIKQFRILGLLYLASEGSTDFELECLSPPLVPYQSAELGFWSAG